MTTEFDFQTIRISLPDFNKGRLDGLPKNPRFFRDYRYDAMKKSIEDSPEMLNLRELIVYPVGERYIVVCGNLRLRACKELGYKELPCKVLNPETPVKKLREYATKDNVSFGENDMDVMMNDRDKSELQDRGIEFAPEPEKDEFKERFEAITDETADEWLEDVRQNPIPIPSYTFDVHTGRGKKMGRTKEEFFRDEYQGKGTV